jgi:rhodanese-related sulfurtransferase
VPSAIDIAQVEQLLADGAQLVEALPEQEYEEGHLPGAVSLPLKRLTPERAAVLDRGRPVVVYCWDSL